MKLFLTIIYKYKLRQAKKRGITRKKVLQLVLFAYKHKLRLYDGICGYLYSVCYDLYGDGNALSFSSFNGFVKPDPLCSRFYWWPIEDRTSRIKFLEDLIAKQD